MIPTSLCLALVLSASAPSAATAAASSESPGVPAAPAPAPATPLLSPRANGSGVKGLGIPARWILLPVLRRADGGEDENPTPAPAPETTFTRPPIGAGDEPVDWEPIEIVETGEWLRAPFGDHLLTDPARWRPGRLGAGRLGADIDYNRVDRLRIGGSIEMQDPSSMAPRFGGRLEYALGRKRTLYGGQLEQPLAPPGRLAAGVSMVRRTDHNELQQVDDFENTLALLFGRQDYRDYFEREGAGVYLSWRVPDFSTVSVHARSDEFRSLAAHRSTRSWFQRDRTLRDNPAIEDGTERSAVMRFERLAQTTSRTRAGFYHWVEIERAGGGLGGDFDFTRILADLRSVFRLTPGMTLSMRAVGGHNAAGRLPRQRWFPLGGVDGLRAHSFSQYLGDQLALGQAEYDVSLWHRHSEPLPAGLHALVFADAGAAWMDGDHRWDILGRRFETDGGFGFASADDALRVYFAKNLRKLDSDFVISMRLQRPF